MIPGLVFLQNYITSRGRFKQCFKIKLQLSSALYQVSLYNVVWSSIFGVITKGSCKPSKTAMDTIGNCSFFLHSYVRKLVSILFLPHVDTIKNKHNNHKVKHLALVNLKPLYTFGKQYCPSPTLRVSQLIYKTTNL